MPYTDDSKHGGMKDARQIAYQTLKSDVLDLLLPPGAKLNEAELAASLGMSRTPVRDVFMRLTREFLVEQIPQRGAFVAHISPTRVESSAWLWSELGAAVLDALYVERPAHSAFLPVQQLLTHLQIAADKHDFLLCARLFTDFHAGLYRLAGLELAWEAIACATGDYQRMLRLADQLESCWDGLLLECGSILDSVTDRNPSAATRALRHQTARIQELCILLKQRVPALFVLL